MGVTNYSTSWLTPDCNRTVPSASKSIDPVGISNADPQTSNLDRPDLLDIYILMTWAPFSCRAKAKLGSSRTCRQSGHGGTKPWECCDVTSCTRSIPPKCSCEDVVDNCTATCKVCKPVYLPRRVCLDQYTGDPGPKCTEEDVAAGGYIHFDYLIRYSGPDPNQTTVHISVLP
nr:uncharacterized protein LOC109777827 [Aegilops tauschii subsp. strangulata]